MTERKICNNCAYQKAIGVSISCQRCFNKSLWKAKNTDTCKPLREGKNDKTIDYGKDLED